MKPDSLTTFYEAAASVAGALIGLLFVAITVAQERTHNRPNGTPQQIRAAAALTSFTNALAVSLFTLIEGQASGTPATVVRDQRTAVRAGLADLDQHGEACPA